MAFPADLSYSAEYDGRLADSPITNFAPSGILGVVPDRGKPGGSNNGMGRRIIC